MQTRARPAIRVPRPIREQQMLDVAGQVFARRGYAAATMDEIAAGVGVTKPMLYAYHGSKQELYLTYIERAGRQLLERMASASAGPGDADARLRAGALAFFEFVAERRDGWAVLHREASSPEGPLGTSVERMRAQLVAGTAALLGQLAGRGAGARECELLAIALVGAGESLANHSRDEPEALAQTLTRLATPALAALRAGIAPARDG